jgi:hypothetical protein
MTKAQRLFKSFKDLYANWPKDRLNRAYDLKNQLEQDMKRAFSDLESMTPTDIKAAQQSLAFWQSIRNNSYKNQVRNDIHFQNAF